MKYLYLIVIFFIFSFSYGNSVITTKFYMEIKDKNYVPIVEELKGKITLIVNDNVLNEIFNSYQIVSFGLAFPGTKRELLLRTYIIDCDVELINILNQQYSSFYTLVEVPEIFPLFIPNDFDNPALNNGQPELTFVGAEDAWDISTGNGVKIGIAESIQSTHEDLSGKSEVLWPYNSNTIVTHGTQVALIAGASTNNNIGMSSIGFNSYVLSSIGYQSFIPIAQNGGRVINCSWGSCNTNPVIYENELITELWEDYNVVIVAAAGNGSWSCPSGPRFDHFPASYNNVISVTNVGHQYKIGTNGVPEQLIQNVFLNSAPPFYNTYNENVDISAPGWNVLTAANNGSSQNYAYGSGTSYSAPMVTGTIGLMFGVNECLFPEEIETILKLTAFQNDLMPENISYQGLIGAGRLDAYLAVDMARDMIEPYGTVEIKDRIINRWDFILKTNPYNILLTNNIFKESATLDFTAQNEIEIDETDFNPGITGFTELKIDTNYNACSQIELENFERIQKNNFKTIKGIKFSSKLFPNPNTGDFTIIIENEDAIKNMSVIIYDILGKPVFQANNVSKRFDVNLPSLTSGVYFVKLSSDNYNETLKFVKQ